MKTITLIHNAIISRKWYSRGSPIPKDIVPKAMLKYEAPVEEQVDDEPKETNLMRQYGHAYSVDSEGRMGHPVGRQIAQMQAANRAQEFAEDEMSEAPNETLATAIEEAGEDLKASVDQQIASMGYLAKAADDIKDSIREEQDARVESGEYDILDSPREEPKPKRQVLSVPSSKLFVRRQGRFVLASSVELIPGEKLFRFRKKQFGVAAKSIAYAQVKGDIK